MKYLIDMKPKQKCIILCIQCGDGCCQRLCDLGLTKGTEIMIIRKAPLHGPIVIRIRNTNLIIGRGMASKILVEQKLQ